MKSVIYAAAGLAATTGSIFGAFKVNEFLNKESEDSNDPEDKMTLRNAARGTGIYIGAAMN